MVRPCNLLRQTALGYPNDRWRGDPLPLKVWPPDERDDIFDRSWHWTVLEAADAPAVDPETTQHKTNRDRMKRVQSAGSALNASDVFSKQDPYL